MKSDRSNTGPFLLQDWDLEAALAFQAFATVKGRCHLWTAAGIAAHMLPSKGDMVRNYQPDRWYAAWQIWPLSFSTIGVSEVGLSHSMKNVIVEY